MKRTIASIALTVLPALVAAQQASTSTQASASATGTVTTPRTSTSMNAQASSDMSASAAPSSYTAENRAKIDASFEAARKRNLPQQPIRDRIAEGQAKGASETQVTLAAQHAETRLEATQDAMVRAGRQPSQSEVSSGYQAMVHGASSAQIETVARQSPPGRSLSVSLDALTTLELQGVTPAQATASVVSSTGTATSATSATTGATAVVKGAAGVVVGKPPMA